MGSYFVRPTTGTTAPRAVVVVVPELFATNGNHPTREVSQAASYAVVACRRRRGRWEAPDRCTIRTGEELHCRLEAWSRPRETTWVFCPSASDTLLMSGFLKLLTDRGATWSGGFHGRYSLAAPGGGEMAYRIIRCSIFGKPDVLHYEYQGHTYCWVSTTQYLDCSEDELATMVDYEFTSCYFGTKDHPVKVYPVAERAELYWRVMKTMVDWWLASQGGHWGITVGALALAFWRARLAPRVVLSHDNEGVKRLEKLAIHAGRASTFCYADIDDGVLTDREPTDRPARNHYPPHWGPLWHLDVASMYPHLLESQTYPVRLVRPYYDLTPKNLADLLPSHHVIAMCTVSTRHADLPMRTTHGTIFPTGNFATVLTGPELKRALDRGDIMRVIEAAAYEPGQPFRAMSQELLAARQKAKNGTKPAWEAFIKSLSNTFSGKLSQRAFDWHEVPGWPCLPDDGWGNWIESWPDGVRSFMARAWLVWEKREEPLKGRPMGACYATLTAYGRLLMDGIRAVCPERSVLSQDTDGLWVDRHGFNALAEQLAESPGCLREKKKANYARFYTPKHYYYNTGKPPWVLAGYHDFSTVAGSGYFVDWVSGQRLASAQGLPAPEIIRLRRETRLKSLPHDGTIDATGWYAPLVCRCATAVDPEALRAGVLPQLAAMQSPL